MILGTLPTPIQGIASDQYRLLARCVKRKAIAKGSDTVQTTLLHRVILGIEQTIGNHIGNLAERLHIKASSGKRRRTKT